MQKDYSRLIYQLEVAWRSPTAKAAAQSLRFMDRTIHRLHRLSLNNASPGDNPTAMVDRMIATLREELQRDLAGCHDAAQCHGLDCLPANAGVVGRQTIRLTHPQGVQILDLLLDVDKLMVGLGQLRQALVLSEAYGKELHRKWRANFAWLRSRLEQLLNDSETRPCL